MKQKPKLPKNELKEEASEHPSFSKRAVRQIVKDHQKKGKKK